MEINYDPRLPIVYVCPVLDAKPSYMSRTDAKPSYMSRTVFGKFIIQRLTGKQNRRHTLRSTEKVFGKALTIATYTIPNVISNLANVING